MIGSPPLLPQLGPGIAFEAGATNMRMTQFETGGEMYGHPMIMPTPKTPQELFALTGRQALDAAYDGARWAVLGNPGPTTLEIDSNDNVTQRLRATNITALSDENGFDPIAEMIAADSAFEDLITSGEFTFLAANDGHLAAMAGARLFAGDQYNVVADIINGTGTGGFVVVRDLDYPGENLFHPLSGKWEMGHLIKSLDEPTITPESTISGTALDGHFEQKIRDMHPNHPVFKEIARGIANIAIVFGLTATPDLIVMSGGIAIEAQDKYRKKLEEALTSFAKSPNPMARLATQAMIAFPPVEMTDTYELYGAPGTMRSHLALRAISQMKRKTPLVFPA